MARDPFHWSGRRVDFFLVLVRGRCNSQSHCINGSIKHRDDGRVVFGAARMEGFEWIGLGSRNSRGN